MAAALAETIYSTVLLLALVLVAGCYQAYRKEAVQLSHEDMMERFLND
ncbi:MAG: hypothetical protein WKF70_01115 [Chitinophagaceae bacterium]